MMIVMPSNHSSIATCLQQKPMGNDITDPRRKKRSREDRVCRHRFCKPDDCEVTTRFIFCSTVDRLCAW
jgi:hypothetical protein